MASQIDDTEFIDREFQESQHPTVTSEPEHETVQPSAPHRNVSSPNPALPTREELEAQVGDTQNRLLQLKRQQEELEQQRVALEETRRRRKEFHDGKAEMLQNLTRGIALLEEAELSLRRDSTQMNKALEGFREGLEKISECSEEAWNSGNVEIELTRALTAIENARMEWNSARLKWSFLDGEGGLDRGSSKPQASSFEWAALAELPFGKLCKIGFALSLPLVVLGGLLLLVLALGIL